ncbi:MAG: hypothetical protein UX22_C0030G0005 [Candidatus Jorgensenbacteria bacterium GW2011_GWA2_45_9]|uniref:Uncharacterized protein n=1 Tax=Candidatus Jorgensenbacteria bacterium GW2011_GWA2_45_9 TaxID=1618663 RepID=A0A0G1N1N4_9BACT|nr:MAG: hypothetical protein UX22_C0030G0005 [Candidatus Jorgensenbacteria bacterium GW2011_GWA2_45_9]
MCGAVSSYCEQTDVRSTSCIGSRLGIKKQNSTNRLTQASPGLVLFYSQPSKFVSVHQHKVKRCLTCVGGQSFLTQPTDATQTNVRRTSFTFASCSSAVVADRSLQILATTELIRLLVPVTKDAL